MSNEMEKAGEELRRQIEMQAGAVLIGPDVNTVRFTFDRQTVYPLNYLMVTLGGFATAAELQAELTRFVMAREFNILGNPTRLQRAWNLPATEGFPQGPLLIWRAGHTPSVKSEDGVWSGEIAYCVFPPFAHVSE